MLRTTTFLQTSTAVLFGAGLSIFSATAAAQTVLSYSPWLPAGYVVNDAVMPWIKQVEVVTEGRVKVVPRAAGVGAPKEQFDVVRDGLADISLVVPGYTQGRFPLMELGELPLLSSDAAVLSPAFYRQYEANLAKLKPFRGTHVLSAFNVAPAQITTRADISGDISKFKGVKMYISNAPVSNGMESVGSVPVVASIADTYTMASSGVIDGAVMPFEPTLTWNLHSAFKNIIEVPGGLGQASMALLINGDKWDSLDEADQAAIMKISGEALASEIGRAVALGEKESAEKLREMGVSIKTMSPEMYAKLAEAFEPVDAAWIAKAQQAGLDNAGQVLADFRADLQLQDDAVSDESSDQ